MSFCSDSISYVSTIDEFEDTSTTPENRDTDLVYNGSPYIGYLKIGKNITYPILFFITLTLTQFFASFCDYFVTLW